MKQQTEPAEAIMINVPEAFFAHDTGKVFGKLRREAMFRQHYESMGTQVNPDGLFYHFISTVPVQAKNMTHVYVCFHGKVQYKAIIVEFLKNKPVMLPNYEHPTPRNWMVTTGPVVKAPKDMMMTGFRGFRYTKHLF